MASLGYSGSQPSVGPSRPRCLGLSSLSLAFIISLAVLYVMMIVTHWSLIFLFPLALLMPVLICYFVYGRWLRGRAPLTDDLFLRIACGGFWPATILASLVEGLVVMIIALITIGWQVGAITPLDPEEGGEVDPGVSHDFGYYMFLFLLAFIGAAMVEEIAKAMVVRCTCLPSESVLCIQPRDYRPQHQASATVALMLAAAVGFATAENLGYLMSALVASTEMEGYEALSVGSAALTIVLRSLVSMPVHALCAVYTGLRLTVRDVQKAKKEALVARASVAAVISATRTGQPMPGGSQPVVVLADGSTGQHYVVPPAEVGAAQPGADGYADASQIEDPSSIKIWSWPRVLWPAIAIHGSFDFIMLLIVGELVQKDSVAAFIVSSLLGVIILIVSYIILNRQFMDSWESLSRGDLPPNGITCRSNVLCRPCCWQPGFAAYSQVAETTSGTALEAMEQAAVPSALGAYPVPLSSQVEPTLSYGQVAWGQQQQQQSSLSATSAAYPSTSATSAPPATVGVGQQAYTTTTTTTPASSFASLAAGQNPYGFYSQPAQQHVVT